MSLSKLYEKTIDSLENPFHVVDRDFKFLIFNRSFHNFAKCAGLKIENPIGKNLFDIFPFLSEKVREEYNLILEGKKDIVTEEINLFDRNEIITETRKIPVIENEKVEYIITVVRDITEKKKHEMSIMDSEQRLRLALESAKEGIWDINFISGNIFTNREWVSMLGYDTEKIRYNFDFWIDLIHPEDRDRVVESLNEHLYGKSSFYESVYRIKKKNGEWIWILDHGKIVERDESGKAIRAIGTKMDITDRKILEEKLQESEEKFRKIANAISTVFWMISSDWKKVTYVSPAFEDIYEYKCEEIYRNPKLLIKIIHTDDKRRVLSFIKNLKTEDTDIEFRIQTKTGIVKWIRNKIFPVKSKSGEILVLTGITEDISEKRELENKLNRAEKMESLGLLAGSVAHDLNNSLLPLVGFSDMLLKDLSIDSKMRESLEIIKNSGIRAAETVQDLLTLTKRGVYEKEVVDLNSIIAAYLNSPEFEVIKKKYPDINFHIYLDNSCLKILGSENHLYKSIMNLVSNAVEAIEGEGEITLKTEISYIDKSKIKNGSLKKGMYIKFIITDTGQGIEQENLQKIFEPFYTKKGKNKKGTGLGLSVVWGTVNDHNGYIDVKSKVQNGTTFTLYFPLCSEKISIKNIFEKIYRGKGENILVIDDSQEQRDVAEIMLKELGYNVYSVESGKEAIHYMNNNSVDLIILDMLLQDDMDGYKTYSEIIKFKPHQKAIIVSGFAEDERVKSTQKLGAGIYLEKPYIISGLSRAVKEELEKKKR